MTAVGSQMLQFFDKLKLMCWCECVSLKDQAEAETAEPKAVSVVVCLIMCK